MIKETIDYYLQTLKYFFIPLGMLFLGLSLGLSYFIPDTCKAINEFIIDINHIIKNPNLNFGSFFNSLIQVFISIDFNDFSFIKNINYDWISQCVNLSLEKLLSDEALNDDMINTYINTLSYKLVRSFYALVLCTFIFSFFGFLLTRSLVRKTLVNRKTIRALIVSIVDSLFSTTLITLIILIVKL
ncbi:MAG: hypothetical protein MR270_04330, partial [Erysipelotrichaceae bacterium]|nr:hypothetical protein [Erysipelotrichaceae bacterium]